MVMATTTLSQLDSNPLQTVKGLLERKKDKLRSAHAIVVTVNTNSDKNRLSLLRTQTN